MTFPDIDGIDQLGSDHQQLQMHPEEQSEQLN